MLNGYSFFSFQIRLARQLLNTQFLSSIIEEMKLELYCKLDVSSRLSSSYFRRFHNLER